jgi:hypothetical protein
VAAAVAGGGGNVDTEIACASHLQALNYTEDIDYLFQYVFFSCISCQQIFFTLIC